MQIKGKILDFPRMEDQFSFFGPFCSIFLLSSWPLDYIYSNITISFDAHDSLSKVTLSFINGPPFQAMLCFRAKPTCLQLPLQLASKSWIKVVP